MLDRTHKRLAEFEKTPPDELRNTEAELPAAAVMLLGSASHGSVRVVMHDRNAGRAIEGVVKNTYYEGRIRVLDIWTAIEYMKSQL